MLIEQPIATPGIFTLAGIDPRETAVIERTEREARVRDGAQRRRQPLGSGWLARSRSRRRTAQDGPA